MFVLPNFRRLYLNSELSTSLALFLLLLVIYRNTAAYHKIKAATLDETDTAEEPLHRDAQDLKDDIDLSSEYSGAISIHQRQPSQQTSDFADLNFLTRESSV